MIIQLKDIDDWTVQDFVRYIKSQCNLKGIEYTAKTKQSFMILGRTFKLLKLNNKSKSWLKSKIDLFLNSETTDVVTNLLFINYLTRTFPKQLNDNTIKNLPKVSKISEDVKRKLIMLKAVI
jgi:hypothetical protein